MAGDNEAVPVDRLSSLSQEEFVAALDGVDEHSPWVAESAWRKRPFKTIADLHRACVQSVREADPEAQLALIRAHPELAGKAAIRGELTADSTREQSGAGLDRCSPEEFQRLTELNRDYAAKFGFPFIIAGTRPHPRKHNRQSRRALAALTRGRVRGSPAADRSDRDVPPSGTEYARAPPLTEIHCRLPSSIATHEH